MTADSITLANGCVVKVGDVIPLTSGEKAIVIAVETDPERQDGLPIEVITAEDYDPPGWMPLASIDLAALAAQQAATVARDAGAQVAGLQELVERWRERADAITVFDAALTDSARQRHKDDAWRLRQCADDLARLSGTLVTEVERAEIAEAVRVADYRGKAFERIMTALRAARLLQTEGDGNG